MPDIQGQLVLAQNQHAFIQDSTKGTVQVYAGPHALALSGNDRPVVYDKTRDEFVQVPLNQAITQNPLVPEGHYLILENPVTDKDYKLMFPKSSANSPVALEVGRKIVIPGPATFPLWPGQFAQAVAGHHLRSNQFVIVRVYNADEANKNRPDFLKTGSDLTPGQLLVIKGTAHSFFIPHTGFEVLQDSNGSGNYVQEALTLERLEYCILLSENGSKRYEKGPQVVFPEATERFVVKDGAKKFKALELNDQMGLYIKVIADHTEDGRDYKTGDELFVTGKEQRIYYPRSEHALIEYKDPKEGINRQRYYGVTIPKGEGRYVLDKTVGDIQKVTGPQIFLPDPRNQVIVRRVLDDKTVELWYPNNIEALTFNRSLRSLSEDSASYLADSVVVSASADISRSINRGTQGSKSLVGGSYEGDKLQRGTRFTPPPMLTLNTKYDGVPCITVWTGYAVQVVNRSGDRRVEVGPTSFLLEYDETLEVLELSSGKPKTTDHMIRDCYLRVDNNLVSDIIRIETKDLVRVDLKVSYRVNFLREHQAKWFSVENYVKYLCDHMRSMLKASMKKNNVTEVMENSAVLIRDVVLGSKSEAKKRTRLFEENGMEIYDVEVLGVEIADTRIADLLKSAQTKAVETAITLSADEQNLENTRRKTAIQTELAELETNVVIRKQELSQQVSRVEAETIMVVLRSQVDAAVYKANAEVKAQEQKSEIATAEFTRIKTNSDYEISLEAQRTAFFEKRMAAITPNLIEAMNTLGQTEFAIKLSTAIAPLAINEQLGLGTVMERTFKGTALEQILTNLQTKTARIGGK